MTKEKIIEVKPGRNLFRLVGVQQPHEVENPEFTETGWPKNTTTDLKEIIIEFYPGSKTCDIMVCDKV